MALETPPVAGQEPVNGQGQAPTSSTAPQAGADPSTPSMTLEEAQAALKAARHDAASYRTRLANLEKAQTEADAAKLAEQGKYKELAEAAARERDTLKAQLADKERADLAREIAAAHKLPAEMATRLVGTTREELAADAAALAKLLAQPATTPTPGNRPNPRPQNGVDPGQKIEADLRASGRYNAI